MTTTTTDGRLTDRQYWDQIWTGKNPEAWANLAWTQRRYSWIVWDQMLRRRLRHGGGRRFLEVGCGSAKWLIYFHKVFGYSVTGCDYSDKAVEGARKSLVAAGVPGTVLKEDLFALTGKYDVICSYGLIEHFEDPRAVLAKFASMLAPGGTLLTMVPNLTGLSGTYHKVLKPETFTTHRAISEGELRGWCESLGLRNLDVGPLGSVIPLRFPRDKMRRRHPLVYKAFWSGFLGPLTWSTNRACSALYRRFGVQMESASFSPYLYAIGDAR
jgi:2-polyprenyl-3-methyl-5-hydroxy-6-metoxy-1,4-benzoquinol methylase